MDERVLGAICEQLGVYIDAVEAYLASLQSVPRDKYTPAELVLPATHPVRLLLTRRLTMYWEQVCAHANK